MEKLRICIKTYHDRVNIAYHDMQYLPLFFFINLFPNLGAELANYEKAYYNSNGQLSSATENFLSIASINNPLVPFQYIQAAIF